MLGARRVSTALGTSGGCPLKGKASPLSMPGNTGRGSLATGDQALHRHPITLTLLNRDHHVYCKKST